MDAMRYCPPIQQMMDGRRPLPIALAHSLVVCKPGRDIARLLILNRLFNGLTIADAIRCRNEIQRCRAAVRGELLAEVV